MLIIFMLFNPYYWERNASAKNKTIFLLLPLALSRS